jgi:hypothetical protein
MLFALVLRVPPHCTGEERVLQLRSYQGSIVWLCGKTDAPSHTTAIMMNASTYADDKAASSMALPFP